MAAVKKVAVIGFGNIGVGVVRALYEKGVNGLELAKVVDIDLKTRRPVKIPKTMLSDDWKSWSTTRTSTSSWKLSAASKPAKSIQMTALKNGKDVVTAIKNAGLRR